MNNYINLPAEGAASWRGPVPSAVNLPVGGNTPGDVIVTLDTQTLYEWNGTSWIAVATPGAAIALDGLIGDVTATGPGVAIASLVATSNSTLTTLSALSLPYSQVNGGTPNTVAFFDGSGDLNNSTNLGWDGTQFSVIGTTSLDGGAINTDGTGILTITNQLNLSSGTFADNAASTGNPGEALSSTGSGVLWAAPALTVGSSQIFGSTVNSFLYTDGTFLQQDSSITTDSNGAMTWSNGSATQTISGHLAITGSSSLDGGNITTNGSGDLTALNVRAGAATITGQLDFTGVSVFLDTNGSSGSAGQALITEGLGVGVVWSSQFGGLAASAQTLYYLGGGQVLIDATSGIAQFPSGSSTPQTQLEDAGGNWLINGDGSAQFGLSAAAPSAAGNVSAISFTGDGSGLTNLDHSITVSSTVVNSQTTSGGLFYGSSGVFQQDTSFTDGIGNLSATSLATINSLSTTGFLTVTGVTNLDNSNISTDGSGGLYAKMLIANTSTSSQIILANNGGNSPEIQYNFSPASGSNKVYFYDATNAFVTFTLSNVGNTMDNGTITTDGSGNLTTNSITTLSTAPVNSSFGAPAGKIIFAPYNSSTAFNEMYDNNGGWAVRGDGSASFASGNLTWAATGAITSNSLTASTILVSDGSKVISSGTTASLVAAGMTAKVASANLTGQTAANASIATFTPSALGTFRVGGYITITAISVDVIQFQVTYTDETAASRTQLFFPQGLTSANLAATGSYSFPPLDIRAASGSAITAKTVLTTGAGSITYDVGTTIYQID